MFCSKNEWDANDKNEDGMEKMQLNNKVQHVYLVGAKSLGAYGGYETFVYKLTEYHQNKENIKYHVACKANGDGCMPALQSLKQSTRRFWKIWKVNAI